MRREQLTTLLIFMLAISTQLVAQKTPTKTDTLQLTLKQAQELAMQNNISVRNDKLDARILKMRTIEILATGFPNAGATLNYTNNFQLGTTATPATSFDPTAPPDSLLALKFGTSNNLGLNFAVTQLIADGRYFVGLKANKAFLAIAKEQTEMTEIQVRNTIATAYYAALVAEEGRRIIDGNIKTVQQLQYETNELYKAGFAEELDADRITLSLSNLQSKLNEATVRAQLTKVALNYQIGIDLSTPVALTDSLEGLMVTNPALLDAKFNYKDRVEYKLLQLNDKLKGYDVKQMKAAYMPSIGAFFNYGFSAQRLQFDFFDTKKSWYRSGNVGIQINIPITDGYKSGAQMQQKKLDQLKNRNNMQNFENQANLQLQQARTNYINAISDFETQKRSMALAQKIFDKVKAMNKEGVGTSFELAQAETSLTEAQGNYINAIYTLLINKTELDKAFGKY